ncbi:unnamed protein product [Fraxinus pennsylvanica]|uniref:F-box/LRR-repeat protein 15/At3g58940/PEG3-like LRR domain-containing protein n=1 Tax=Fraxinus pennsylvanica TaxID=56036 RepID=A0AAD2EAX2_9LAMI|nr:unnamed protein product [Fraxinus pennsylvanica]
MIRLELCEVSINHEVLESLISSCPLLEELVLHVPNKFDYLEINAPMLKLLALTCPPASVRIKKSSLLEIVQFVECSDYADYNIMKYENYFIELFDSLPSIQKMCTDYTFMEELVDYN